VLLMAAGFSLVEAQQGTDCDLCPPSCEHCPFCAPVANLDAPPTVPERLLQDASTAWLSPRSATSPPRAIEHVPLSLGG